MATSRSLVDSIKYSFVDDDIENINDARGYINSAVNGGTFYDGLEDVIKAVNKADKLISKKNYNVDYGGSEEQLADRLYQSYEKLKNIKNRLNDIYEKLNNY